MIDVHCHLTDEAFKGKVNDVIERALRSGVRAMVTSGIGYEDCLKALSLSDNSRVYPSLGIEPYELEGYEMVLELISASRDKIVAVGEVGLDLYLGSRDGLDEQKRVFRLFLSLAMQLDLPIVVHSRNAGKHAIDLLLEEGAELVVMHAFDGKPSYAEKGARRGFYFSIPPSIARSDQKRKLVSKLPLENLMLESDAPVLGPSRGEVNEPRNLSISAEWISRIKGVSVSKVVDVTTENALNLFKLRV